MWGALASIAGPIIGNAIGGLFGYQGQRDTNATNLEATRETNAANVGMNTANNALNRELAAEANATNIQLMRETNQTNRLNVDANNRVQMQLAKENRDWQEQMSNTAYQRQVSDMKAAGLNPILAAMRGGGASTPSGNVADTSAAQAQSASVSPAKTQAGHVVAPVVSNELTYLGTGISSGITQGASNYMAQEDIDTRRAAQESTRKLQEHQSSLLNVEREKVLTEAQKVFLQLKEVSADTRLKIMALEKMAEEIRLLQENQEVSRTQAEKNRAETDYVGAGVDKQVGKMVKDVFDAAGARLDNSSVGTWLTGGRKLSIGDATAAGAGVSYGGPNSAMKLRRGSRYWSHGASGKW